MKVTGFTFIRNAMIYDYPIIEAIESILPVCDEFVVAVGKSDDNTLELIKKINQKSIRIIETVWDDRLRTKGRVLALETDKAFQAIDSDTDWAFYIQGDEIVHENYLESIRKEMEKWHNNPDVDGLLFNYLHFYGSYDYIAASSGWYKKEIRIIKNKKNIYSYRDAQGFRKGNNQKLNVKPIDAFIYHYGWVKPPSSMQKKQENFNKYWHDDRWMAENIPSRKEFDYSGIGSLYQFTGTHPTVMQKRISGKNWKFDFDISREKFSFKEAGKKLLYNLFGIEAGYRNYNVI